MTEVIPEPSSATDPIRSGSPPQLPPSGSEKYMRPLPPATMPTGPHDDSPAVGKASTVGVAVVAPSIL